MEFWVVLEFFWDSYRILMGFLDCFSIISGSLKVLGFIRDLFGIYLGRNRNEGDGWPESGMNLSAHPHQINQQIMATSQWFIFSNLIDQFH